MARLRGHQTLDFEKPLLCKRTIEVGGRTFKAGEVLPWRQLGLPPRKVHQLWDQRRVGHEKLSERNGAESVSALVKPAVVQAQAKSAPAKQRARS